MRRSDARGLVTEVVRRGGRATVTVDYADPTGRYVHGASAELVVLDPRLKRTAAAVRETAPGRYVAEFDAPQPGAYHLELTMRQAGQVVARQSRALAIGYPDELRLRPPQTELLRTIAAVTGGQFDPAPAEVLTLARRTARRATSLWPALLESVAVLLVLDVLLRRIDLVPWVRRLRRRAVQ
jgi:hypothetical protein